MEQLTYGLRTASDLLAKLDRDAEFLRKEVSSDRFFNFVVTANSLPDWVQNDPTVNTTAKNNLARFRLTHNFKICRDLANASKHFTLDPKRHPNPKVKSAKSDQGFGVGRYGMGEFGTGEERISVVLDNRETLDGTALMEGTLGDWKAFFAENKI